MASMECVGNYIDRFETDLTTALVCIATDNESRADAFNANVDLQNNVLKTLFLVYCSTLVFIMQAGFAMICSGCVRKKNVQNTILKNLLDVCGSSIAFFIVGFAFAYGGEDPDKKTFIGSSDFFLRGNANKDLTGLSYIFWMFQFSFAATAGKFERLNPCNTTKFNISLHH